MIFVFAEDGSLEVIAGLEEARRDYEGIDVESGVFQFFDDSGTYLEPQFTKPNRTGRFLGVFKWVESGEFELVRSPEADEDIHVYLAETNELKPNPWFSELGCVRRFLTSGSRCLFNRSALKQQLNHSVSRQLRRNDMSNKSDDKYCVPSGGWTGISTREITDQEVLSTTWNGEKTIWLAAAEGDVSALQSFLTNKADVNVSEGNQHFTPLICAAATGQRRAVEFLLDNGANVNAKDMSGTTPLMAASAGGHIEIVKLLFDSGADVTLKLGVLSSYAGETASELAIHNGCYDVVAILEQTRAR